MIKIILLLFVVTFVNDSILSIDSKNIKLENFDVSYVKDENSSLNIKELQSRLKKKLLKNYEIENFFITSCYGLGYKI